PARRTAHAPGTARLAGQRVRWGRLAAQTHAQADADVTDVSAIEHCGFRIADCGFPIQSEIRNPKSAIGRPGESAPVPDEPAAAPRRGSARPPAPDQRPAQRGDEWPRRGRAEKRTGRRWGEGVAGDPRPGPARPPQHLPLRTAEPEALVPR